MLKYVRYPQNIASQLIVLVTVSAVIFHICMWITFFVARPANPSIVHQLVDLLNALDLVPANRQPELMKRFEMAHPGSPVLLIPSSTPRGKQLLGPVADLMKPLLPRGTAIAVEDEQNIDVFLPTGITVEATLPSTSRVGPPRLGDLVFPTLLFVAFSVTLFLIWAVRGITGPLAAFAEAADGFTLDGEGEILCEGGSAEVSKARHAFNRM